MNAALGNARLARSGRLGAHERMIVVVEIVIARQRVRRLMRSEADLRLLMARVREGPPASHAAPEERARIADRLAAPVRLVLQRLPGDSRCYVSSLVLISVLAQRGVDAVFVLGVDRDDDALGAHAWVEVDGRAVLPPGAYHRLVEL